IKTIPGAKVSDMLKIVRDLPRSVRGLVLYIGAADVKNSTTLVEFVVLDMLNLVRNIYKYCPNIYRIWLLAVPYQTPRSKSNVPQAKTFNIRATVFNRLLYNYLGC